MTDKEKYEALVAEIKRRYKEHKEHENDYAGSDHFWRAIECREILTFSTSMQKEDTDKPQIKSGVVYDGDYIKFDDRTLIDLDPMSLEPAFELKEGEKVKVVILKE